MDLNWTPICVHDLRHHDAGSLVTIDVMLADRSHFRGGELCTAEADGTTARHTFERGDALVFVSMKPHSVRRPASTPSLNTQSQYQPQNPVSTPSLNTKPQRPTSTPNLITQPQRPTSTPNLNTQTQHPATEMRARRRTNPTPRPQHPTAPSSQAPPQCMAHSGAARDGWRALSARDGVVGGRGARVRPPVRAALGAVQSHGVGLFLAKGVPGHRLRPG